MGALRDFPPQADDPGLIQFCGLCLGLGRRHRQAMYLLDAAMKETGDRQEALLLGAIALLNHVQLAIQNGPQTHVIDYRVPDPDDFDLPSTHVANKGAASRHLASQDGLSLVLRYQRNLLLKARPPPEAPKTLPMRIDIDIRTAQVSTENGKSYLRFSVDVFDQLEGKPSDANIASMKSYFGSRSKGLVDVATEGAQLVGQALDLYKRKDEWSPEGVPED